MTSARPATSACNFVWGVTIGVKDTYDIRNHIIAAVCGFWDWTENAAHLHSLPHAEGIHQEHSAAGSLSASASS